MIHQEVTLPASPDRVYAVLTDGKLFTEATGGRAAEIGRDEGSAFSLFGGAPSTSLPLRSIRAMRLISRNAPCFTFASLAFGSPSRIVARSIRNATSMPCAPGSPMR